MKKKYLIIISFLVVLIVSCAKNYHEGNYESSDEYKDTLGNDYVRNKVMNSIFFDAMINSLIDQGFINSKENLTMEVISKVDKLNLSTYNNPTIVTKSVTVSLKGIELFTNLKELDVRGAKFIDYSDKRKQKEELRRVRRRLLLDTTRIYHNIPDMVWGPI